MQTLRTRFKKDIVAEFVPPRRPSGRAVILCPGAPSVPKNPKLLEFFAKKKFWVFFPRYRGTWESGGRFLAKGLDTNIKDVIEALPKGFKSLLDGKKYKVKPSKIYLIGSSFGGPAMLLLSKDPRVKKIIAFSPVVDWLAKSRAEPLPKLSQFMAQGFGSGYRVAKGAWKKLAGGKFYNPAGNLEKIDGKKIFIIQARDDRSVLFGPVKKFAAKTHCQLWLLKSGGHLSASLIMRPRFWKKCNHFLKN